MIAICIQIHVGDMSHAAYFGTIPARGERRIPGIAAAAPAPATAPSAAVAALSCLAVKLRARTAAALTCSAILLAAASPVAAAASVPASPPPQFLAGVNVPGLGFGATPQEADRTIAYAARLHVAAVRTDVPWAVLDLVGAETAARHVQPAARVGRQRLASGQHGGVCRIRGLPGRPLPLPAGGDRDLERARSGERTVLRRSAQGRSLRGAAACRVSRDQAGGAGGPRARRLAGRLQRRVPARPLRRGHQGLLRRAVGALLQPHAGVPALDPRSPARLGRSHAAVAGRAAGRANGCSRTRRA